MKRVVVKLGTSSLTNGTSKFHRQSMLMLVQQMALLHQAGYDVLIVTSGAQTAGNERLGYPDLSGSVTAKQMLSAVGQSRLMQIYANMFDIFEVHVAQILLTRDDLSHRTRYLNARDTILTLFENRIIPIVNENDTIATEEIRVGDNDNLSALVASVVDADLLVMLTDQKGLYTADPRHNPQAELMQNVDHIDDDILALAGGAGTQMGTGGMATKLQAAQIATRSGIQTVIARSTEPNILQRLIDGEDVGTRFMPASTTLESRKRWLLTDRPKGVVRVDVGAERVLRQGGASLLPVGITNVDGEFERGGDDCHR